MVPCELKNWSEIKQDVIIQLVIFNYNLDIFVNQSAQL